MASDWKSALPSAESNQVLGVVMNGSEPDHLLLQSSFMNVKLSPRLNSAFLSLFRDHI